MSEGFREFRVEQRGAAGGGGVGGFGPVRGLGLRVEGRAGWLGPRVVEQRTGGGGWKGVGCVE